MTNIAKVNNIDTSGFFFKAKHDTDKSELENKIPDTSGLVKETDYNAKIKQTVLIQKIKYLVLKA